MVKKNHRRLKVVVYDIAPQGTNRVDIPVSAVEVGAGAFYMKDGDLKPDEAVEMGYEHLMLILEEAIATVLLRSGNDLPKLLEMAGFFTNCVMERLNERHPAGTKEDITEEVMRTATEQAFKVTMSLHAADDREAEALEGLTKEQQQQVAALEQHPEYKKKNNEIR